MSSFNEIEKLARSDGRLKLLRILDEQPSYAAELATQCGSSQASVGRYLTSFEEVGWVTKIENNYRITTAGKLVKSTFQSWLDNAVSDNVSRKRVGRGLFVSDARIELLEVLRENSGRASELSERCNQSKSTIESHLAEFEGLDWARREKGEYQITPDGSEMISKYEEWVEVAELIDEAVVFLRYFDPSIGEEMTKEMLNEASVVSSPSKTADMATAEFIDEVGPIHDQIYGIAPIISPLYNRRFEPLLGSDVQIEIVTDEQVIRRAIDEYGDLLEEAHMASNMDIYIASESITFGLAFF